MAKNKIITSQGNVQFINSKGKSINMHPMHCYAVYENDTVSFLFIYMKDYSGQAFFASQYEDLEVNGESYDNIEDLKDAITEAFAKAGAQARTEIVDELPETGFTNTIYLVKKVHGSGYDEYVYTEEGEWELIGDTDIEFERYLKIVDFEAYSSATEVKIDTISGDVETISGDVITLSGALDTEIAAREAADSVISGAVDTVTADLASEVSRALSAEAALGGRIDTVSNRIDAEQIARAAADAVISGAVDTVSGAVDTEVTRAEAAEAALSGAIDTNAADIDALESALADEVSARTNADTALQSQISTVSGAVQTVASDLTYEVNRAEAAEGVLSGAIDTVSGDVVSEISRAEAAEAAIDAKVDTLSGEVQTLGDDKAEKAEAVASAVYVSSSTTIDLMNISGEVISQVDATDFVVDGMVDEVKIENGYLVIVWNTDAGKQETRIPLTDIFNPDNYYDKDDIDDIVSGLNDSIDTKLAINDFNTYSGAVETELGNKFDASAITAYSTSLEVTAEIEAATSGKADIEDVYFKSEIDDIVSGLNDSIDTKADLSALTEDERVWGEALNDINSRINDISGDVLTSGDVQTQIDNSISGKVDADDVYTKDEVDGLIGDFVTGEELCSKVDECITGTYVSYEGLYDAVYDYGFIDGETFDSYTGGTDARLGEIEVDLNSKANAEDVQSDLNTKVDNEEFIAFSASVETRLTEDEEVTAAGLNALNEAISGKADSSAVTEEISAAVSGKQDTLIAGSGITISGNVISAEGGGSIDSGAVESMIENYMTDSNYSIENAYIIAIKANGSSGINSYYNVHGNDNGCYFYGGNNTKFANGWIAPANSYGGTENSFQVDYYNSSFSTEFKTFFGIKGGSLGEYGLALIIPSENYQYIPSQYKQSSTPYFIPLNGYVTTVTLGTDIDENWDTTNGNRKTWSNVSGSPYVALSVPDNYSYQGNYQFSLPSGNQAYSLNGLPDPYGFNVWFGEYVAIANFEVANPSDPMHRVIKPIVLPISTKNTYKGENNSLKFTSDIKAPKTYSSSDLTVFYGETSKIPSLSTNVSQLSGKTESALTKAESAYTIGNSANTTANNALEKANVQSDWNQSNSGSSYNDYIKNRPMYEEYSYYFDTVYQSTAKTDVMMMVSFTTSSALSLGDKMKFTYSSDGTTWTPFSGDDGTVIFTIVENTGQVMTPDMYVASDSMGMTYASSNDLTNWTFRIMMGQTDVYFRVEVEKVNTTVHKLDNKFLNIDSAVTSSSTNAVSSSAVNSALGGLKLEQITQAAYDALVAKDPSTLYIIVN